tara:strand:- start:4478 stop:5236 length:759 start_codon:yes stop_codon:yes gene_type:complete
MRLFWLAWITLCTLSVDANTPPKTIYFNDNETVNAVLSSIDMNRIVIDGDQVQNISCPSNFCTISAKKSDQSGAVLLSLSTHVPFVLYVTTKNQKNFGVFVTPQAQPATTTIFKNKSSRLPSFVQLKKEMPYESLLADFMKSMIQFHQGQLKKVDGFHISLVPNASQQDMIQSASEDKTVLVIPTIVFSSQEMSGMIYRLINQTGQIKNIHASDYYSESARAASVSRATLGVGEEALLYIITSKGGEAWHPS